MALQNPVLSSCYTDEELAELVGSFGKEVKIDRSVRIFGGRSIRIGNRVRIDCFGLISAGPEGVEIGSNVHLAAGCCIFGGGGRVVIEDFCGISCRTAVYTASDDYVDGFLTGPTLPDEFRKIAKGPVTLRRHAIVGAGAVLLPGVTLEFGASVGALTLVRKRVGECEVVYGNPMQTLPRKRNGDRLRELEAKYLSQLSRTEGAP